MTPQSDDIPTRKQEIPIVLILGHYAVTGLSKRGGELWGPCPIHNGGREKRDLHIDVRNNSFVCFSQVCCAHGNALDFVAAMEKCSVQEAALKVREWMAEESIATEGTSRGRGERSFSKSAGFNH